MNNKYKKKYVRTFIFVTISFLYLTVFENDLCGSANYAYDSDQTNIEVIYQPELLKEFQPYKGSYSFSLKKSYGSFYLENTLRCRKKLFLSINKISTLYLKDQNSYSSTFHHIISILQKNNTWHQSSDDDSFLNDYC